MQNAERALQNEAVRGPDGRVIEYRYNGAAANRALGLPGKEVTPSGCIAPPKVPIEEAPPTRRHRPF